MLKISRLTVEHLAKACVTDCEHPRVSFQLESDRENVTLDHAVIRIGDWSVETDAQILIPYEGKQLMPFTEYTVHVTAVDNVGETATADLFYPLYDGCHFSVAFVYLLQL